ncbi:MAG: hypothetical protein ACXW2A_15365 [Burkholderiales bacterium]
MENSPSILELELRYAIRMVRTGFITPEQASRTCGVPLPALQNALGEDVVVCVPPPVVMRMSAPSMNTWVPV